MRPAIVRRERLMLSFRLSQGGTVSIAVQRPLGRKRWRTVGTLTRKGLKPGQRSLRFTGRYRYEGADAWLVPRGDHRQGRAPSRLQGGHGRLPDRRLSGVSWPGDRPRL